MRINTRFLLFVGIIVLFLIAIITFVVLHKINSPKKIYRDFASDFERIFMSGTIDALDSWVNNKTMIKCSDQENKYYKCKDSLQYYVESRNRLIGGSITDGSIELTKNDDGSIEFSLEAEGYYNYPTTIKEQMEVHVIIGPNKKIIELSSKSSLFAYIFFNMSLG